MGDLRSYIRSQGVTCAVVNAVLNPVLAWFGNRTMAFVPLAGANGILVDTAVTSLVLSLLVSLFVTRAVRRELDAGRLAAVEAGGRDKDILCRLPRAAWPLGLAIGTVAAVFLVPLVFAGFSIAGSSGLPFAGFAALKALYTPVLGYLVTRWVILREVTGHRATRLRDRSGYA